MLQRVAEGANGDNEGDIHTVVLPEALRFYAGGEYLEPFRDGCPVCTEREQNAPDVEAKMLSLLGRSHDEYERQRREILHDELAVVAEFDA